MQVEDGAAELVVLVLDALDVVDTVDVDGVELGARDGVLDAADEEELLPVDPVERFISLGWIFVFKIVRVRKRRKKK